jgi:DNA-binding MarR family transcriptional regulator
MKTELKIIEKKDIPFYSGYIICNDKEYYLSSNEIKTLLYCYTSEKWISQIARHLGISPKNVSVKIDKLLRIGAIKIKELDTNKKYIKTICKLPLRYSLHYKN